MDALRQLQRLRRQAAGADLGASVRLRPVWAGQFKMLGADRDLLALPLAQGATALNSLDAGALREDGSPSFGAARFVLGFSSPGGPDVLE